MAHYKRKYREAVGQVAMWLADDEDIVPDETHPVGLGLADYDSDPDPTYSEFPEHSELQQNGDAQGSALSAAYDEEPLSSSDESSSTDDMDGNTNTLQTDLADFMVTEHLTRQTRNRLLAVLRKHGHDLPKDSCTLTKTPRVVDVVHKCGGKYVYFGLRKYLQVADSSCDAYYLTINIDGIPVFKSTNLQFWPILCSINALPPMLVALYVGTSKPTSVDEFLEDFVTEVEELQANGFVVISDLVKPVVLRGFVCDAPARAFIKNIKGHNSLSGCERCVAAGVSVNSRTTFLSSGCYDAEKRTHNKFVNQEYAGSHQIGETPLCRIAQDCVNMCALDYMHLVCLGAVRRMLMFLKKGCRLVKLSSSQLACLSEKLIALRHCIPSEFARRPRSLSELDRWKATEFRQFLIYTGPVVLKSVLTADLYKHFLCLSVSVAIMLSPDQTHREHYLQYACELMHHFVSNCAKFYGNEFLVYNIHSLLHLGDDVKFFKASLNDFSSFPFENFLQTLKRLIRSPSNPVSQVVKRIQEFENVRSPLTSAAPKESKLSANRRDSMVMLKNGKFAEIIDRQDASISCAVYRRSCLQPFFTEPCSSDIFDIVYVPRVSGNTYIVEINETDVARKAMKLPHGNGYVLMPLVHNE